MQKAAFGVNPAAAVSAIPASAGSVIPAEAGSVIPAEAGSVIPAEAGIQCFHIRYAQLHSAQCQIPETPDSRLRGNGSRAPVNA